jgi:hypothetical protein
MRTPIWPGLCLLLAACPGNGPDTPPQPLQIGRHDTATDSFVPVAAGEIMAVVLGPNGLNMVVPSLRAVGIDPSGPDPTVEVDVGGVIMAADIEGSRVDMQPDADGYVLWDLRVPFQAELCCYNCVSGAVHATLEDASGNDFEGSVTVMLSRNGGACPDPDVCCASADLCEVPELALICP